MTYVSIKHYEQEFPLAYRQWKADRKSNNSGPYPTHEIPGCAVVHGYSLSFTFEFECETLDARNWCVDFGSLKPLKEFLKENFDHTLLVAEDDPHKEVLQNLHTLGLAKVVMVEATGCEALSKFLHEYVNDFWLPTYYPNSHDGSVKCRRVIVAETPSNKAWYEG